MALLAVCAGAAGVAVVALGDGERPRAGLQAPPATRGAGSGAVTPAPPRRYRIPARAVRVSHANELRAALAGHRPRAIVLAPGTYPSARPFRNPRGHDLYAASLGAAVLEAGLNLGGTTGRNGGLVRGVVFDVRQPRRTIDGAIISIWGTSRRARVLDTVLRGHGVVAAGISARQPEGLVIERVRAHGFTDYGVLVDANELDRGELAEGFRLEDIDVAEVARPQPGSSDGQAEACIWIGNTGTLRRARVRSCGWTGLWTGTATRRATVDQVDVDRTRTGVYLEHYTTDSTFRRLWVGPRVRIGLVAEWASPAWNGNPASVGNLIEHSRFETSLAGVYLDEGTTHTTIRRSAFAGQRWAAIGDYRGTDNAYYANDYRGLADSAARVSNEHPSEFPRRRVAEATTSAITLSHRHSRSLRRAGQDPNSRGPPDSDSAARPNGLAAARPAPTPRARPSNATQAVAPALGPRGRSDAGEASA